MVLEVYRLFDKKSEVQMPHIHEKIDFTVGAYIVDKSKVLLVHHRKFDKWLSVGGHIELDEDPIEALRREVREEAGLEIILLHEATPSNDPSHKSLVPPRFMDIHPVSPTHQHIGMYYVAMPLSGKVTLNIEEHLGIGWFSKEELASLRTSIACRTYATIAIEEVDEFWMRDRR
jgi:8-oxo-dGTP diphosphatase